MTTKHYRRVVTVLATAAALIAFITLTLRAVEIEYGDPRCSQITTTGSPYSPQGWQANGWNVKDGYEPLSCQIAGEWYYLEEDGSITPL